MTHKIGESTLEYGYRVEFHSKNKQVIAKVYQTNQKIGKCVLEGDLIKPLTYDNLKPENRLKIKELLDVKAEGSDEELSDSIYPKKVITFAKKEHIHAIAMTISSQGLNVKGGQLINIAHEIVKERYDEMITDVHVKKIEKPKVINHILYVQKSEDWFLSLGGWKGMMPSQEVQGYRFEEDLSQKFVSVRVYDNGVRFPINNCRIYVGKDEESDLTYPELANEVERVKKKFQLEDFEIAYLQLCLLSRKIPMPDKFKNLPKDDQTGIVRRLDYFNSLMFGMEASGLNAGLAISLMTLDLIVSKEFGYKTAFHANNEGGVYPYSCFGDNKGTYSKRELVVRDTFYNPYSMKQFRVGSLYSPVAVKEAMMIKRWLKVEKMVPQNDDHATQVANIEKAIDDLIDFYFFPEKDNDSFSHKKLRKNVFNENFAFE